MRSILDIRLQNLFGIAIVLKVGASFIGWRLQDPWILGLTVPLAIMGAYIVLGMKRRDTEVSDEKFADSCYYLGFIFTITSIIVSLFDLPKIGTDEGLRNIAVRFGAAMISTVLGLGVRVYLVSFKRDVADAIQDAEEAVIDASKRLGEQLRMALEKLQEFQVEVNDASTETVERVNLQVEALSRNHADKLTTFFADLTKRNQEAFTKALDEVKAASSRLAESVDGYSLGMRANLTSIEAKVTAFTEAITDRLKTTTFPDDYFARQLEPPLMQLKEAANSVSGSTKAAATEVKASSIALAGALKKMNQKASATEDSLDTVLRLTTQQQGVLDAAQGQLTVLERLSKTLSDFDSKLTATLASITANTAVTSDLTSRVASVISEGAEARKGLETSLNSVVAKLSTGAAASALIAGKLGANATATEQVTQKLDRVAAADLEAAKSLMTIGQQASLAIGKVDHAASQLQDMVRQLAELDSALRSQSSELRHMAEKIKDVKVNVEISPLANALNSPATLLLPTLAQPAMRIAGVLPNEVLVADNSQDPPETRQDT